MRHRQTQFPENFVVRKVDETSIYLNCPPVPERRTPGDTSRLSADSSTGWKSNRSYDIRVSSRIAQAKSDYIEKLAPKESLKDRYIRNKIHEIQRQIITVKSLYSASAWRDKAANASRIPSFRNASSEPSQIKRKSTKICSSAKETSDEHILKIMPDPVKPVFHKPISDNPYRRKFNVEYDRAYRKAIQSFFYI